MKQDISSQLKQLSSESDNLTTEQLYERITELHNRLTKRRAEANINYFGRIKQASTSTPLTEMNLGNTALEHTK